MRLLDEAIEIEDMVSVVFFISHTSRMEHTCLDRQVIMSNESNIYDLIDTICYEKSFRMYTF